MTLKRLVIATTERSGSTLLASMLQSHPQLRGEFEPLAQRSRDQRGWRGRLDYLAPLPRLAALTATAQAAGAAGYFCKIFPFHTWRYAPLLRRLAQDGWHVLELRRESVFRQAISLMAARRFGSYHAAGGQPINVEPKRFPTARFLQILAGCEDQRLQLEAACVPLKRMTLVYERDLAERSRQQQTFDQVTDYLGVTRHAAQTAHERPFLRPYSEIILNYRDLEQAAEQFLTERRRR
jgi:LPS sulfotransferase NodH